MLWFAILVAICCIASRIPCGYKYVPVRKEDIDKEETMSSVDLASVEERDVLVAEVKIDGVDKTYSYLTNGFIYSPGECVLVPFGSKNTERVAEIVSQKPIKVSNLPVPFYKMKAIIEPAEVERQFEFKAVQNAVRSVSSERSRYNSDVSTASLDGPISFYSDLKGFIEYDDFDFDQDGDC